MFKFFPDDKDSKDVEEGSEIGATDEYIPCKEILVSDFHSSLVNLITNESGNKNIVIDVPVFKTLILKCVNLSELSAKEEIFKKDEDKKVQEILKASTDLVPGVYEGGFKTWECTFDLITYIQSNLESILLNKVSNGKRPLKILDMGCGSGLLGLAVLNFTQKRGMDVSIDFQDYNDEVINYVTIPNTLLNFKDEVAARCKFFAGDWESFKEIISEQHRNINTETKDDVFSEKYDLILSSETIYNLEYFPKFLRLIKTCLQRKDGTLYLAAKTFYFGVGGGTNSFLSMVNEDKELQASVVHVIKQGVQREIIRCGFQSNAEK